MSGQKHGHRHSNGREKGDNWEPRPCFLPPGAAVFRETWKMFSSCLGLKDYDSHPLR